MSTRFRLAALVFGMTNAVLFGAGIITVLVVPDFAERAIQLVPVVVVLSVVLAAPIAWWLAPRLRLRFWRARDAVPPVPSANAPWRS